ncbi:MAG: metallophosphoesterase family protein [Thermomicrobiales bacterium]
MAADLVFVHLSDLHLTAQAGELVNRPGGAEVSDPHRYLPWVVREVRALDPPPAFVVISGDLVDTPSGEAYQRVREFVAQLEAVAPVLLGIGNHDDRAAVRRIQGGDATGDAEAPSYYTHCIDGVRIVMLDSKVPGEVGGALGPEQLAWLDGQLREREPGGTIVVLHHPVVESFAIAKVAWRDGWLLNDAEALRDVLQGRHVLRILAGHVHVGSVAAFAGTVTATAPPTVWMIDPLRVSGQARPGAGFNLCAVRNGTLIVNPVVVTDGAV